MACSATQEQIIVPASQVKRLFALIALAKPQKGKLFLSGFLAIVGEGFGIIPYLVIYKIIAEVSTTPVAQLEHAVIYRWVLYAGVAVVLKHLCMGISTSLSHVSAFHILYALRIALAKKLHQLPLGYFNQQSSGQLKKVMSEDVEQMEIFLAHHIPDVVAAVVYTLVTTLVLFAVDWRLALATILVVPAGMLVQMLTIGRGGEQARQWLQAKEQMNAAMIEYIQGMPIIKAFNHTVDSFSRYSDSIKRCLRIENEMGSRWFLPTAIFSVSITANMLLLLPVGAAMYLAGMIALEKFVFFLLMGVGFGGPMWVLLQFGRYMQQNLECQERINNLLNTETLSEPQQPLVAGEGIVGAAVSFGYNHQSKAINGINFSIKPRTFIAIVGPSGAGKTTLARLIPRFWDVDSGSISLGEADIRNINVDALMDQFSLIFQQVYLFNDTVRANLKIGNSTASDDAMIIAAKKAQCHNFIMQLPQGYDTVVGEKGGLISGGEKQRLSIARALLKDAPILVVDEATAFVDPENEALVQKAINEMVVDKTLIVIAHRLSTIVAADEIWVMDKGKIIASGTHQQLLNECRLYEHMWQTHMSAQSWLLEVEK